MMLDDIGLKAGDQSSQLAALITIREAGKATVSFGRPPGSGPGFGIAVHDRDGSSCCPDQR